LKEHGFYDNSLVIFIADHGEEFWDHGGFEHGHTLYEELIHVPLIIHFPGGKYAGKRISEPTSQVDILPTILDALKINEKNLIRSQGVSLLPLLENKKFKRVFPVTSGFPLYGPDQNSIRSGKYRLILTEETGKKELFDLNSDSAEMNNIASQYPEIVLALSEAMGKLDSLSKSIGLFPVSHNFEKPNGSNNSLKADGELLESLRSLGYVQ